MRAFLTSFLHHSLSYCYAAEISFHPFALAIKPLNSPLSYFWNNKEKLWRILEEIEEYSCFFFT
jgi:hypothetical protein